MVRTPPDTDELLDRTGRGDDGARQQLLMRHRARLRQMVAIRLDRRLAARVDPSDIVQEALAAAAGELDDYLRDPPLPFYPWLRQFACQRIEKAHRRHLNAQRRSVAREENVGRDLPDDSIRDLARRLLDRGSSPSRRLLRDEQGERLKEALSKLAPADREVIVMRILEQMETAEIAAILEISEGAVRNRQSRALLRLRALLEGEDEG